jgi:hypothetical protein
MVGRVGLILVHGIGEQKRFAHLDAEIRGLIDGLKRRPSARFTVEILGGGAATYNAEQDTWASGPDPSARITLEESGDVTEINVHEVWWADVNEPYSFAKQIRFWFWGLSIWAFPESRNRPDLTGYNQVMVTPSTPDRTWLKRLRTRGQLYLSGLFFLMAAFSLGAAVFFAKRIFGFEPPDFVRVFVNYISGVKLYNQSTRQGSGLLPNSRGFLDTLDDPPRVSIRRRMIQTIVAVACRPEEYDRWYILAHSLGSVVAFNGIMENGQCMANYLPRETWNRLTAVQWGGPSRPGDWVSNPPGIMSPSRPVWLRNTDLVYRDKIFEKFRGILTYGSPLGKFAELWPVRVPVNKVEPIFQPATEWINVFDGRDPVAGPMDAYDPVELAKLGVTAAHCPPRKNFPYAASRVLLLSHIRYLTMRNEAAKQLPDVIADWLIDGKTFVPPQSGTGRWHDMTVYRRRVAWSWMWWLVAAFALAVLGTVTAMGLIELLCAAATRSQDWLSSFIKWLGG